MASTPHEDRAESTKHQKTKGKGKEKKRKADEENASDLPDPAEAVKVVKPVNPRVAEIEAKIEEVV